MPHYKFNVFFSSSDVVETIILANCPSKATAKSMENTAQDGYYFSKYLDGLFVNYHEYYKLSFVEEVESVTADDNVVQFKFMKKDDDVLNYDEEDQEDQEDVDSVS